MKSFWVSLTRDLMHVYIELQAESEKAVRQYLQREYMARNGEWKLPWCGVYSKLPENEAGQIVIRSTYAGTIYEEPEENIIW